MKNHILIISIKYLLYLLSIVSLTSCERADVVFDIPPLIGKDIDEVRKILNIPIEERVEPRDKTRTYNYNSLEKDGYTLLIRYNPKTRQVTQYLIVSNENDFDDYTDILKIGNLDSASAEYWVESDRTFNFFGDYSNVTVHPKGF